MAFVNILFLIFSFFVIAGSFAVISFRNPVYSVLSLIFVFFNAAGIFVLLGAEMLAMLLVIVYVGAVAVLFLFVVMMLNIKITKVKEGFQSYLPVGIIFVLILFIEIVMVLNASSTKLNLTQNISEISAVTAGAKTNAHAIGNVLYTDYVYPFQVSGLILLVAMIGAIVLTLRDRVGVKKQSASKQQARNSKTTVKLVKVKSGKGVE
jgi:NADH-quinone oxidoreductase subunit J